MTNPSISPENVPGQQSRRTMIRNTVITAAGAALLPSFMTSCSKADEVPTRPVGYGSGEFSAEQLQSAADNLNRMRALLAHLYSEAFKYDETVFLALASTTQNGNWTNFIVDIIIDIAIAAVATAAAATGPEGFALAVPALAGASSFLHDWGIGKDRPDALNGLNGFFSEYQAGQLAMAQAIDEKLGFITDVNYPLNDHKNLQAAWKDPIQFNGTNYTLADLAKSHFPDKNDNSIDYYKIYNPMYDHHRKSVWNLAIMKCCTYSIESRWTVNIYNDRSDTHNTYHTATEYAQQVMYPQNPGRYLRGRLGIRWDSYRSIDLQSWNLGINGYSFPDAAVKLLFKDDTPGHIINPAGLFNRNYVFQQFALTKPVAFLDWNDMSPSVNDFDLNKDWNFTGGLFPRLIH